MQSLWHLSRAMETAGSSIRRTEPDLKITIRSTVLLYLAWVCVQTQRFISLCEINIWSRSLCCRFITSATHRRTYNISYKYYTGIIIPSPVHAFCHRRFVWSIPAIENEALASQPSSKLSSINASAKSTAKPRVPFNFTSDGVESQVSSGNDCVDDGVDYWGADIKNVNPIYTIEECEALCYVEEGCVSLTHRYITWLHLL